jgi:hypothetical protein
MSNAERTKFYVDVAAGDKAARVAEYMRGESGVEWAADLRVQIAGLLTTDYSGPARAYNETLARMLEHGIDNVRGVGDKFSTPAIDNAAAFEAVCGNNRLCFKCGNDGHFSAACENAKFVDWKNGFRRCGNCGCRDHFRGGCNRPAP